MCFIDQSGTQDKSPMCYNCMTIGKLAELFFFSWIIHSLFRLLVVPLQFVKKRKNNSTISLDINCINLPMLVTSLILLLTLFLLLTITGTRQPFPVPGVCNWKYHYRKYRERGGQSVYAEGHRERLDGTLNNKVCHSGEEHSVPRHQPM